MGSAATRRTVQGRETLRTAARRMARERLTCLVALDGGTPRGVVTDRDVALAALGDGLDPAAPAASLRWRPLVTVGRGASADEAIRRMELHGLRHLPVSDPLGRIVGMVAAEEALALVLYELSQAGARTRCGAAAGLAAAAIRVGDVYAAAPTLDGEASARAAAMLLRATGADAALVRGRTGPPAVVTEHDLLAAVAAPPGAESPVRARDLGCAPLAGVHPGDRVEKAVALMLSGGLERIAVVRDGRTLGVVGLKAALARMAFELAAHVALGPAAPTPRGPRPPWLH